MISPLKLKIKLFRSVFKVCVMTGRMSHGMRGGQRTVSAVHPESVIIDSGQKFSLALPPTYHRSTGKADVLSHQI